MHARACKMSGIRVVGAMRERNKPQSGLSARSLFIHVYGHSPMTTRVNDIGLHSHSGSLKSKYRSSGAVTSIGIWNRCAPLGFFEPSTYFMWPDPI